MEQLVVFSFQTLNALTLASVDKWARYWCWWKWHSSYNFIALLPISLLIWLHSLESPISRMRKWDRSSLVMFRIAKNRCHSECKLGITHLSHSLLLSIWPLRQYRDTTMNPRMVSIVPVWPGLYQFILWRETPNKNEMNIFNEYLSIFSFCFLIYV